MNGRKKKQILMGLMSENEQTYFLELLKLKVSVIEAAECILDCRYR